MSQMEKWIYSEWLYIILAWVNLFSCTVFLIVGDNVSFLFCLILALWNIGLSFYIMKKNK
jgi:hypothetical protein